MNKMVICYLRVSSTHQDSTHQLESIQKYANEHNLKIDKVFRDDGISAFKEGYTSRPSFLELLELVQQNKVSDILVFESSRISRQNMEFQNLMQIFTQHGTYVHSTSENTILNQNEIDTLLLSIKAFFNEKSSKETSLRIKSAKELLRKEGKFQGGRCAWGFHVVGGYEQPIEDMKEIIISFFNDYITYGRTYVSKKYNCPNRRTVISRIANEKYIDVVGEGVFNRANELRISRSCSLDKPTKGLNRSDILLEGLLYHKCGCRLSIHRDRNKRLHYWRCTRCKGNSNIIFKKSFGRILDNNIEYEILKVLDNLDNEKLVNKYTSTYNRTRAILSTQSDMINKNITDKNKTLKLASAKLERYILNNESDVMIRSVSQLIENTNHEIETLKKQLEDITTELNELKKKEDYQQEFISNILNAKDIYKNASIQDKKAILNLLIKEIIVRDTDDYDIYLNI